MPVTPEQYAVWAHSLTHMREQMISNNDARIFLGGKRKGHLGRYPGIVEETFLSMKAGKPTYLLGLFGGVTQDVILALEGEEPAALTREYQLSTTKMRRRIEYFNSNISPKGTEIDYRILLDFFQKNGIQGLNNGLTEQDNKKLFTTNYLPEIISLIMKGLVNRFKEL